MNKVHIVKELSNSTIDYNATEYQHGTIYYRNAYYFVNNGIKSGFKWFAGKHSKLSEAINNIAADWKAIKKAPKNTHYMRDIEKIEKEFTIKYVIQKIWSDKSVDTLIAEYEVLNDNDN